MFTKNNTQNYIPILMSINATSLEVSELPYTETSKGGFNTYLAIAPAYDGFLFFKLGTQKVVKKIGNPSPCFALAYKSNYTIPFEAFDREGNSIVLSTLKDFGEGFYFTKLPQNIAIVKALGKNFLIPQMLVPFEVEIGDIALSSNLNDIAITELTMPEVFLPQVSLPTVVLTNVLADIELMEF